MRSKEFSDALPIVRRGASFSTGNSSRSYSYKAFGKRCLDLCIAAFAIVLLLPMLIVIAFAVKATSRGPVFYKQHRIGRGGVPFTMFKFRTMRLNADKALADYLSDNPKAAEEWKLFQKLRSDPRVTPIGRFLRRSSLDEVPQLFNVFRGEMSVIGPRPCMPQQQQLYGDGWEAYCSVLPGLTGLWQISGRNNLTYEERVKLDVMYVSMLSPGFDLLILLKTIKVVINGTGSS